MKADWARWLVPLLWMAVIFFLSAQPSLPELIPAPAQNVVGSLAHVVEYGVLAVLLHRAASQGGTLSRRALFGLWVWCILYGISDEYHQLFVPGRDATPLDVLADGTGAFLALLFRYLRQQHATV